MKKEEILEKSRAEKKDEGVEFALEKGRLYGVTGMTLLYFALLIFNCIYKQNKGVLAVGLVSSLMAVGFLISHVMIAVR